MPVIQPTLAASGIDRSYDALPPARLYHIDRASHHPCLLTTQPSCIITRLGGGDSDLPSRQRPNDRPLPSKAAMREDDVYLSLSWQTADAWPNHVGLELAACLFSWRACDRPNGQAQNRLWTRPRQGQSAETGPQAHVRSPRVWNVSQKNTPGSLS